MAKQRIKNVTVVGVGLLGGSAALAIKAHYSRVKIAGVGRRESSLARALDAGAIDTAHLDASEPAARADLVILSTPVGAFAGHMRAMAHVLRPHAVVTDVGSTKAGVVRTGERILGPGGPFVGSHPMAGSERTGPEFARADLFAGATCIVTPTPRTPERRVRAVERFWRDLGAVTLRMTPAAHDKAVARVSHAPHVLAALIVAMQRRGDLPLAGTGFLDATRIASGSPEMWREIVMTNRTAILAAIDELDEGLMHFRDLLDLGDAAGIEKFLARAKARRDELVARRLRRQQ
jgi:prephenate dehydrogenase